MLYLIKLLNSTLFNLEGLDLSKSPARKNFIFLFFLKNLDAFIYSIIPLSLIILEIIKKFVDFFLKTFFWDFSILTPRLGIMLIFFLWISSWSKKKFKSDLFWKIKYLDNFNVNFKTYLKYRFYLIKYDPKPVKFKINLNVVISDRIEETIFAWSVKLKIIFGFIKFNIL